MDLVDVGLRVTDKGALATLSKFTGSMHNAGRATEHFERTTKNLTRSLGALGGYFGIRQLVEYADTWTLINNRIRVVTQSQQQANAVQERLFNIAQRTRNTLAATSVLYTRVALNADQLGRSHEELLIATEAVNEALLISGATGVEAAQSMRQLAQALGSGRLQGDEFRTVMEAMPLVARAIADEMGVAVGQLKDLSKAGMIDVQTVLDALIKKHEEWSQVVGDMPFTIGQAFELVTNSLTRMIGIINTGLGITNRFGDALQDVANRWMGRVVAGVTALTAAMLAYKAALISTAIIQAAITSVRVINSYLQMARAVGAVYAATVMWRNASQGIIGIVAMIAAATVGVIAYKKTLEFIDEATKEWMSNQANLNDLLGEGVVIEDELTKKTRARAEDMVREAHQLVVMSAAEEASQKRLEIQFDAVNQRIEARRELQGDNLRVMLQAIDMEERLKIEALGYEEALEAQKDALEERQEIIERFNKSVQNSFADTFEKIFNEGIDKIGDLFDAIKRLFFRLVAEMASAQVMQRLGASFAAALGGIFGVSGELAAMKEKAIVAKGMAAQHMPGALGLVEEGPQTVSLSLEYESARTWAQLVAQYLGPVLGGFMVGRMIGGLTTNKFLGSAGGALGGAATGAMMGSVIPGVGTAAGAIAGGIAGAIGGLLGASKRQEEEARLLREQLEANRITMESNNLRLQEMRDAFGGTSNRRLFSGIEAIETVQKVIARMPRDATHGGLPFSRLTSDAEFALITSLAQELGIQILDSAGKLVPGALDQLIEAIKLSVQALTQWGNNLNDVRQRQEAYNKLFDVENSPQQKLNDSVAAIIKLAPDLAKLLNLPHLDLTTETGRTAALEAMRQVFTMIDTGVFTNNPELLGAFANKDQLIDAILNTKDALDELARVVFDIVTDFPRAMDIIYYEQLYGRYGLGAIGNGFGNDVVNDPLIPLPATSFYVEGGITIINEAGDSGEALLSKIESAAHARRARGGSVDLDRTGESLL